MQINISAKNIELTDALKEYATKKLSKIEHFFQNIQRIDIELDVEKIKEDDQKQIAKANITVAGQIIHASEASESMYASIDLLIDKLDHQIKKHKDKLVHEKRRDSAKTKQLFHENLMTIEPEQTAAE